MNGPSVLSLIPVLFIFGVFTCAETTLDIHISVYMISIRNLVSDECILFAQAPARFIFSVQTAAVLKVETCVEHGMVAYRLIGD